MASVCDDIRTNQEQRLLHLLAHTQLHSIALIYQCQALPSETPVINSNLKLAPLYYYYYYYCSECA